MKIVIDGEELVLRQEEVEIAKQAVNRFMRVVKEGGIENNMPTLYITLLQSVTSGNTAAPDSNTIKATLSAEFDRITSDLRFRNDLAESVLSLLNEERKDNGLKPLSMSTSNQVYQIAALKAADMAIYNHSDFDSPCRN